MQFTPSFSQHTLSSGIKKLDLSLLGGNGFKIGIYDLSSAIDSIAIYEILSNVIVNAINDYNANVLVIEHLDKFPYFKIKRNSMYDASYANNIQSIQVDSLLDLIVIFKNPEFLLKFDIIIIDSFSSLYKASLNTLKAILNNDGGVDDKNANSPIIKFYQSFKKLLFMMQKLASCNNSIIFTVGSMDIFNHKVYVVPEEGETDVDTDADMDTLGDTHTYINQQVFVPTISLKSDINLYYNSRIILYRDWVTESNGQLVSGLDINNDKILETSINNLSTGKSKCLPHFLCFVSSPIQIKPRDKLTGFFLVDNNFQIVDIENDADLINDDLLDIEIPDSQSS